MSAFSRKKKHRTVVGHALCIQHFLLLLLTHPSFFFFSFLQEKSRTSTIFSPLPPFNSSYCLGLRSWKTKTKLKKGWRRKVENIFTAPTAYEAAWERVKGEKKSSRKNAVLLCCCMVSTNEHRVVQWGCFHVVEATIYVCARLCSCGVLCSLLINSH